MLDDAAGVLDYYLAHRRERLAQVEARSPELRRRPRPRVRRRRALPRQVVEVVYADVDQVLWDAAEWSVRAQLAYLASPDAGSMRPTVHGASSPAHVGHPSARVRYLE